MFVEQTGTVVLSAREGVGVSYVAAPRGAPGAQMEVAVSQAGRLASVGALLPGAAT